MTAADTAVAPADDEDLSTLPIVPARHYWRWLAGFVVLVLVGQFAHGLVTNPGWDWPVFFDYLLADSVLAAVWVTLQLTLYGTVLGFALGVVLALMRLSDSVILQSVAWTYVWAFRSIPLIVQLLFWFNLAYLYQELGFGIPFGPVFWHVETMNLIGAMTAAVIGLALHQAAYAAEIVRGGVLAVDPGQREAAAALGIPRVRQLRRIVLPQAMRGILPNAANEIISLFKGTSIVSVMAIGELFYQVQVIYGRNGRVVPLLMVATVWYIVLTTVLSVAQYYVERYFARGAERNPPPTPAQRLRALVRDFRAATGAADRARGGPTRGGPAPPRKDAPVEGGAR
ncbi:amino acid ABC transporter permease [Streptomyces radicis]|uniref:Amino acid ABC transporter permease n=1 Tax=Streptomyces radicis TaxID=1750517 RepID=A0A3A9VR77_9ACTN|nr:amino acid ABC transporter permease [Streptomyces radicis]RKN03220.1 amino acid ABC transporter permease [Streptomyces radicis]RKN13117.1 amino acid ABC transporter permease [Streptomyces radicis]